jgi:Uma2 family endonuclease
VVPGLAAEVASGPATDALLRSKIEDYQKANVGLIWILYPRQRKIHVFDSPSSLHVLGDADTLTGGALLPHFLMPVTKVFEGLTGG